MRKHSWLHRSIQKPRNERLAAALADAFIFMAGSAPGNSNSPIGYSYNSAAVTLNQPPRTLEWPGIIGYWQHTHQYINIRGGAISSGGLMAGVTVVNVVSGDYNYMTDAMVHDAGALPFTQHRMTPETTAGQFFSNANPMTLLTSGGLLLVSNDRALVFGGNPNVIDGHFAGVYDTTVALS